MEPTVHTDGGGVVWLQSSHHPNLFGLDVGALYNNSWTLSCSAPRVGMFAVFLNVIRTEKFFSLWKGVSPVSSWVLTWGFDWTCMHVVSERTCPLSVCLRSVRHSAHISVTSSKQARSCFPPEHHDCSLKRCRANQANEISIRVGHRSLFEPVSSTYSV